MKIYSYVKAVLALSLYLILCSCGGGRGGGDLSEYSISLYKPQYASGFEILGAEGRESSILVSRNPWQGAEDVEAMLFIARNGERPPVGFTG
jgi:iron complex transport system substrate-binding protein